ncbi:putative myosin heavy chain [Trypanosoma theileri]|uniref:Putative myosin heavy chain n=1 Tax=Trypanosoma theileri TaxID=67003 RepID=A0A1X0P0P8_9TRYP|nr:putative myosin heavy chain [Trypanosoma theileri]ORC90398.1 putative myosin heavy chain [Trypanosoma theileri]
MSSHASLLPGMRCMCYHPQHAWVPGTIDSFDGKHVSVSTITPAKEQVSKLLPDDVFVCDEHAMQEDVNDLLNLAVLHDGTLLNCLRIRYFRDVVYTNIGAIVVALNPFNFKIPWYMDDKMPDYLAEGETIQHNLPHSWAVAHTTFYEMRRDGENQCILVSGESGAGKTEAAKIVMKYLAAVSALQCSEEEKKAGAFVGLRMMQSNPILEAFGNAKTVRNDNSSRFGKLMRIKFDRKGMLSGADITKYLLEKSRIITSALDERVYHAFYLVLKGCDREYYGLQDLSQYRSVMSGKSPDIDDVDDAAEYNDVTKAMEICGMNRKEIESVWRSVGAVLSLLNVDFIPSSTDSSSIDSETEHYITEACRLLEISEDELKKEFTTTTLNLREGPVVTTLTKAKAIDARDSFCKALYDNLFGYLVTTINKTINTDDCLTWVALLDIFGFEDFKVNSFEQLCINLTNETLQRHYNYYIFTKDMDECREEGIDVTEIIFPDNSECVDMIAAKGGILAVLDEDCLLAKATDVSFLEKISDRFAGKSPFFERPRLSKAPCFRIKHYAGTVTYVVDGFIEKNRDTLKDAFKILLNNSKDNVIKTLLPMPDPDNKSRYTVGGFFRSQLKDLMELIQGTNPHWIRCIKPHPAKKPLHFDGVQTLTQLRSSGVLGTVQIRKAGYPIRIFIPDFVKKYKIIVRSETLDFSDAVSVSKAILKALGFDYRKAQMGKTRVFLKSEAYQHLEVVKKQKLQVFARVAVCGALVSISRMRTAAFLRHRSVEVVQSFLASLRSQHVYREKDYLLRKDIIIANVTALLALQQREAAERAALVEERTAFCDDLTARRERLAEDLHAAWLAAAPARAARAVEAFFAEERAAREAITAAEKTAAAALHAALDADRRAAVALVEARQAAEREARRAELRAAAVAAWDERRAAAMRHVEVREEARRRARESLREAIENNNDALALRRHERRRQARERAAYPTPQFRSCGVDALRDPVIGPGGLQGTLTSPTHPAYESREREPFINYSAINITSPENRGRNSGSYGSINRSDGIPQECSPSPNGRSRSRHHGFGDTAIAIYSDPLREKERLGKERIEPDRNCSLEIVRRLRSLQTLRDSSFICSSKSREMKDPFNPHSDNWVVPPNGVLMFPDGFSCNIEDVASGKLLSGGDGRNSSSSEAMDKRNTSYYIMDFEK